MDESRNAPTDWDSIPHTDPNAQPVDREPAPTGRYIVHVSEASIRNAIIRNESFLLVEDYVVQQRSNGTERLEVEYLWYGRRPKVTWMNITVQPGDYDIEPSDGRNVVTNIGKPEADLRDNINGDD